jgi:hypothetical protein
MSSSLNPAPNVTTSMELVLVPVLVLVLVLVLVPALALVAVLASTMRISTKILKCPICRA